MRARSTSAAPTDAAALFAVGDRPQPGVREASRLRHRANSPGEKIPARARIALLGYLPASRRGTSKA